MRLGIAQFAVREERPEESRAAQRSVVRSLFGDGAQLIILPECTSHKYGLGSLDEVEQLAEPLDGETVRAWSEWARESRGYLVGGMLERHGKSYFNTAVLVGPHGYLGHYRKVHRFGWERIWLEAGDELVLFRIRSLDVNLGVLICYDLRFSEAVRSLAVAGADVLAVPTTWTSIGKTVLWDEQGYAPQDHLALGHAYANRLFVACADRVGQEADVTYLGASLVAGPGGEALMGPFAGRHPDSGVVDVDIASARDKRIGSSHLWQDRRWVFDVPVRLVEVS